MCGVGVFGSPRHDLIIFHPLTSLNAMKKFFALCSMIVALGFVATGCGGGSSPAPSPTPPTVNGAETLVGGDETVTEVEMPTEE